MKIWITALILFSLFSSFLADGAGPIEETGHPEASLLAIDCSDSGSDHCSDSGSEPCPGDDCQDCHCCHNHSRFLNPSVAILFQKGQGLVSVIEVPNFYKQPTLDSNRRPPKYT